MLYPKIPTTSYETDVIKLQKLWESSQGNKFSLDFTDLELAKYNDKTSQLIPRINNIRSLVDVGGSYQPVQLLLNQPALGNQTEPTQVFGALIEITINNIPDQWIPFVRFNIGTDSTQNILQGQLTWFTEVEEVNADNTLFKVTWHLGYFINASNIPDFQFKIYLTFLNPTLLL